MKEYYCVSACAQIYRTAEARRFGAKTSVPNIRPLDLKILKIAMIM